MKIAEEELSEVGLYKYPKHSNLFGDWETTEFNQKTNELFYFSCVDGDIELYRKVINFEDLKQALYDGFNLDFSA